MTLASFACNKGIKSLEVGCFEHHVLSSSVLPSNAKATGSKSESAISENIFPSMF